MDVIERIHARLPDTHIVMHGSSSVPQEWQDVFNAHGGQMRETYGVPLDELVRGVAMGVRKINIDTDLRLAAAAEFRRVAHTRPDEFDPRKFLKPAMDAMAQVCRTRFEAFGTAGQASRIKVIPLDDMARRYASGALAPRPASLAA
jgi:fructose-bisphosphate aldolase class II